MKILLTSIGTRGDMEPFLAIGEIMKNLGHDVVCLMPEQFRGLAEESGFRFASLGPRFLQMIESEDGKAALGGEGSGLRKFMAYVKLARKYGDMNKELVRRQRETIEAEKPDRIVHNGKAVFPVVWGALGRGKHVLVSPVPYLNYVKGHAHLAFNRDFGAFLNKRTFDLARFGLVSSIRTALKWLDMKGALSRQQISEELMTSQTIYTISPSLFPRPSYWPDNLQVLGYHERDKVLQWKPGEALQNFVDRHEKLLFVTFGSMTNPEPEKKTDIILQVLQKQRIPALINTAAGGLKEPEDFDRDLFHFVGQVPYDWAFPRMYAVVHHGGSGTTHMALMHGCASMTVPHIIDQFVWDKLVAERGAGPRGIRIGKL